MTGTFTVTIIINKDEYQENPKFVFNTWSEVQEFAEICFKNQYDFIELEYHEIND